MPAPDRYGTVIIGAGFGGLGMAAQLARAGLRDFVVLERADEIGGVWRDNIYPGSGCDTEAHLYCYSFALNLRVSRMYAGQPELRDYLHRIVDDFALLPHLSLGEEVIAMSWHAAEAAWLVTTERRQLWSRSVISAWGQLGTPVIPQIPGLESFGGTSFHSAQWDHRVDLAGKRVVSVGNAASAVQYVPEIAKIAAYLTVIQRSANWIMPRNQIVFSDEQLDAFESTPELFEESRRELHAFREDGFEKTRVGTATQAEGVAMALAHLHAQVANPALREKLTPTYEFGCKRILRSDDYYPALTRENVELVTAPIDRIVPEGVLTADDELHEADVIVFGTGFDSQAFNGRVRVEGVDGATLSERWSEGAEAYLGITVDGFPNFFMMYGPNTNLNHNSIATMLEIQQEYVIQALTWLNPGGAIDVRRDVLDRFNERLQAQMADSAFVADCSSWYKNAVGKVINNWSGTVEEYRTLARHFVGSEYTLSAAP